MYASETTFGLTLWVVFVCVLQVVLDRLLSDHLLDLPLRLDVEWILVEQPHLLHTLAFSTLIVAHHLDPDLTETIAVVDRFGQSRPLLSDLSHGVRVPQYAQPCPLDVSRRSSLLCAHVVLLLLLLLRLSLLLLLLLRWARQQHQHVIVLHSSFFQCF